MFDHEYKLPLFRMLWRLLGVLAFPLLIWLYSKAWGISFSELDGGVNHHKMLIIGVYFFYIAFWLWLTPKIERLPLFRRY